MTVAGRHRFAGLMLMSPTQGKRVYLVSSHYPLASFGRPATYAVLSL
jgi:hypothetical protein